MPAFRYAQFCPLARAAELIAERWTLLIVRELLMGPSRFTDLRGALPGVSASVLSERLARLEKHDIVVRRSLPPPAASSVYELGESGRALGPVVLELAKWGTRFLSFPLPDDDVPARAVRISLSFALSSGPTPERCFEVRMDDTISPLAFRVTGSAQGAKIGEVKGAPEVPDAIVAGEPRSLLRLAAGALDVRAAVGDGRIRVGGDVDALDDFPLLFDTTFQIGSGDAGPPT